MGLTKREYTDQETVITAENLNDIQDAILDLEDGLFSVDNNKSGEVIAITDATKRGFRSFSIFGKTTQGGTPTPDDPVGLISSVYDGSISVYVEGEQRQDITVSVPNGMRGIPVSSGGNYTDASGQQWLSDEIDFARGVYVQRIYRKVFMGTESFVKSPAVDGNYYLWISEEAGRNKGNLLTGAMCTRLTEKLPDRLWDTKEDGFAISTTENPVRIRIESISTVEALQAQLRDWANEQNPLSMVFGLATPIETPLSAEEIAAYNALHTYRDHTTVSNDASAHMEIEYVMDAKKYIDSMMSSPVARLSEVTILASKWVGADGLYSQVVTIDGITPYSKVDLLPSVEQLAIFHNKDVAFVTENEDGVVTVFAIGTKPTNDYTMQVSITEVAV